MKRGSEHYIDADTAESLGIHNEPGWTGSFTRRQASGAIPNGTRIVKVAVDGDGSTERNPIGTRGVVLGSVDGGPMGLGYFVEWDTMPRVACGVVAWKIERSDP